MMEVVIAIIGVLIAIMLPAVSCAREQAKVTCVNAELRQIGLCLDMYMQANEGKHPPTRQDCSMGWEDHQLPPELVEGGYLPKPAAGSGMSVGIEDRYNHGNTYKYCAVGELYQNGLYVHDKRAREYFQVGLDELEVASFAGLKPPISCLNDGLQVSTGATLGHGTITVASGNSARPQAWFTTHDHRSIILTLKNAYLDWIKKDIQMVIQEHGDRTPAFWQAVRQLGLQYWLQWNRNELFNLTVIGH